MARTLIDPSLTPAAGLNIQGNILINGGMEFWQRGTSFTNLSYAYGADRWKFLHSAGGTNVVSRQTGESGDYCLRVAQATNGGEARLLQQIERPQDYSGKTLSLTARIKTSIASNLVVYIYTNSGTASVSPVGTGSWETVSASLTLPSPCTSLDIRVSLLSGQVGTYDLDSVMLVIGSQPVAFVPKNYETELLQCYRYCYKSGGNTGHDVIGTGFHIASTQAYIYLNTPVPMRTTPTITFVNPTNFRLWSANGGSINVTSMSSLGGTNYDFPWGTTYAANAASGLTTGAGTHLRADATSYVLFEAEL